MAEDIIVYRFESITSVRADVTTGSVVPKTVPNTVTMVDQVDIVGQYLRTFTDSVSINDSANILGTFTRQFSDVVTVPDNQDYYPPYPFDAVAMSDTLAALFVKSLADTATPTDAVSKLISIGLADSVTPGDSATPAIVYDTAFPAMTSNTAPAGYVASANNETFGAAYNSFRRDGSTTFWTESGLPPCWLQIQFPTPRKVTGYHVTSRAGVTNQTPDAWTLQGSSNGSSWTDMDARSGQNPSGTWAGNTTRDFTVAAPAPWTYYRMYITSPPDVYIVTVAELTFDFASS